MNDARSGVGDIGANPHREKVWNAHERKSHMGHRTISNTPAFLLSLSLLSSAGCLTAVAGDMRLRPGLPSRPAGEQLDIDEDGKITGRD